MARVRTGATRRKRHKKIMKLAKGYWGGRHRMFKVAKVAVERAMANAYRGRKQRKRDFRKLWVMKIAAAAQANDVSYSRLMAGLRMAGVELNRKMLAELAVSDEEAFARVADIAKEQLQAKTASAEV
jgi:large subunit ribosomal protein L20